MKTKFDNYKKQIIKNSIIYHLFGPKKLIMNYYKQRFGHEYDFENPKTFMEKINTRKASQDKLLTTCADKIKVRDYVADKIGDKYLIPQYFTAKRLTSKLYDEMPNECIIKTASGSSTLEIVRDKSKLNKKEFIKTIRKYQKVKFHYIWGEMFYKNIKNNVICEKLLLTKDNKIPTDIKVHCFRNGGNTKFYIQLDFDRFGDHRRNYYDKNFKLLKIKEQCENYKDKVKKPKNWDKILKLAKKLSEDFEYVRVDFYDMEDQVYFGELTFAHNAGLTEFHPEIWNKKFGNYWH